MAEYWSWGVEKFTPEEQQQVIEENERFRSGGEAVQQDTGGGYYDGQMGDSGGSAAPAVTQQPTVTEQEQTVPTFYEAGVQAAQPEQQPEAQPTTSWIAQPQNLMEVWNKYDQDPDYVDEHYSRDQIETLHDYYSYLNQGATPDKWQTLRDDDPFVTDVIKNQYAPWWEPVQEDQGARTEVQAQEVYRPTAPELQGWNEEKPTGDWNDLDPIAQFTAAISSTTTNMSNAPAWLDKTQAGAQALSSAMAGPAALKIVGGLAASAGAGGVAAVLTNPWVLAGAAVGVGGLAFYQAVSGKEIPVFSKFLEVSDMADTLVEHTVGFGVQTTDIVRGNIARANEDKDDSYGLMAAINDSLKEVWNNAGSMWRAGEFTYEMYGSIGDFAIDALKEIFTDQKGTKEGEGWFFNRGLNEKQQLAEGTYGDEGMRNIRKMFADMEAQGIDKDAQTAIMNELVNNAGGTSAFVSDYTAQMLLDMDILATPLENQTAGLVSRITGDSRGVEAAQINSGSMLTQLPFVGSIIQATTGLKAPGGVMEWMDIRKNLARTADTSTLTAADRFFGGIDANGKIKEFARTEKTGMTDMLPESKVAGVGNIANNVLNAYMFDAQDTNDIRNRLASLAGEANGTYDSGMNNSAEVLTVRDGMKQAIAEVNPEIILRQFDESAPARATLAKTAEALGMQVKDVVSLYSETPAVFEQRVRDYAAQHNGMIADVDVSNGVDPISTIVKGFSTAKDGKGTPLAWDIRQVQYQITTSMIDSMAKYYTEYYGVKPTSTVNTVFDTLKSAQSLLLLGWSPSYFINNVINNAVTSAAEGVLGFMTPKQIRQYMDAFGVSPARMDVDVNAEFRGQDAEGDAFSRAVSQAKKEGTDKGLQGALTGINGVLKKANDKLGVFSSLSGKMETLQGNQLTAVSIQQYWRQRWKRGEGFHLMPTALVEAIEAQTPGMTNVIYSAIENGLNMEQIGKTLFNTYVKPDAGTVMKQVCADLFRGEANVYEEVLEKSGVMQDLNERIRNCNTEEERAAVINDAQDRLQKYVDNLRREDLIQRANNVSAVVEAEGLTPVTHIMSEMEMNHTDFWIRQRNEWTDAYQRIMAENMDSPQSRSLLADLVSRQQKEWADLYKQEVSTVAGVMKGLGFQHESHVKYIGFMNEKNQNWQNFNDAKSRELARAYERTNALRQAAGKGKIDKVKMSEVWEDFHRNVSELYDQHFAREQEMQSRMDQAFVEGYEFATQKSGEQLRQNFQRISEIRQRMHDMQQDAHEQTSKMSREDKAKFYEEFNPKYNALIREIGDLGDANARIIDDASSSGPGYENQAPTTMTPEQTVQATEVMDTNNALREKAMRERNGYLDRDGIKQGWIESGRTPFEADLMMAVYDARAEQWARDNGAYPDEFYSQAVTLKGIASWLPTGQTTVDLQDGTGRVYQVDTIRPADINTENFRNWFGNSKVVDENGHPLVLYHGTSKQFDEFKYQPPVFPGAATWQQGFFFSQNRETAEFYTNLDFTEDAGKPSIKEVYLQIENPYIFDFEGDKNRKGIRYSEIIDKAKAEGHDGVILKNTYDGGPMDNIYVVFEPTQIKSIYNGGDWNPNDPNILHQTTAEYAAKYHDIIMQHYGNENFRNWFGVGTDHQSKVVDEYGMPLVVHHGTDAPQFEVFSKEKLGSNTGALSANYGFFFSRGEETAQSYIRNKDAFERNYNLSTFESITADTIKDYSFDEISLFVERYNELYEQARKEFPITVPGSWNIGEEFLNEYKYMLDDLSKETDPNNIENIQWNIDYLRNEMARKYDVLSLALDEKDNPNSGRVMDLYLNIVDPLIHDFEGNDRDITYYELIQQAIKEGHDGCIFLNTYDGADQDTIYVVFEPTQIKSIENDGSFNKLDPNILHQQAIDKIKGTFEHTDVGNIIRMLNASDVSTMVHESGHLFRRTLSQPLMQEFATWAGFESVSEFQELEVRWQQNDPTLSEADRQRYVDAEEKFARGFEQYLMDGSAPTPGLKAVFKQFRDYLLDIYQKVKATVTGNDYSNQGEFVFHGATGDEGLNINAEINGVKLREIFDRMLTDDVQRMPGFQELVTNLRTQLGQDRHNMRMSDKALTRRAQAEVTKTILQNFGSMEEAEAALQNYQLPMEINGWRVDDATLYEAIQSAKNDATMNPFAPAEWHEVKGANTYAYSITEANTGKKYQLQYKVVELKDLQPSNVWFGDQLVINEDYPADAQARNRQADQSDVYAHAANLNPGLLIDEQRAIDSGAPIVGEGNLFVESGNGRVLSLLYAQDHFPEQWANYQEYLRNSVGEYGIDPAQLDSFENPVLIRERLGGDSVTFAEDANSNRNKVMTASENALTDANKVNMTTLSNLDIVPGEGIDTFTTEKNAQPSVEWLRSLPEMERARYSTTNRSGDLILSADGRTRFVNALFATLYATPESMDIIRSFSETSDSNIQALESALKQSLPEMARAEGLIQTGSRAESLSITADVMAAAGLLEEARKAGINIHDYLAQQTIPGMERWTPTQALLAGFFGDAKNNVKRIRDFLNAYGEEVYKAGDPNQLSLFSESKTREQMINDALASALGTNQGTGASDQGSVTSGQAPALAQSVMDSDGKWSSQFAKVLDENLQRTFDDGMSMPLDQAESVYLRGDVNVAYETRVQRLLRDFSNSRNLSADQYLYAWEYMEWWVQGSVGEAPKGNPIWEADIQKQVMQDFTYEHPDLVKELQRRYQKGAEVDPDTAVPNKGDYFKRTYGFEHGFWNIAGNVYRDGVLVAFLPEELDRMQKTIEVDGQSYKVLGIDRQNPEGLVYYDPVLEIVRTCNVGKPEGFDEPRNPFAFIRPARQGSTPQTMPVADAYAELQTKYLNPALAAFGEAYNNADTDARTKQMSGLGLQTRAQIMQWLDQDVKEDMRLEKYRAMKYSDMKKDAAMLNYSQRYGFDPILTMLSPYQFWYTRSMWKWAKRMIDKPALGNAYQRMQEYEDKNRQENLPSRVAGRWRIPMPYLPDWMGGSYYVDLNAQLFPFAQFGQSYSSNMNTATLNARTQEILEQQVQSGMITAEEKLQAVTDKKGEAWANAYAQAETEIGRQDGLNTLASQFISPNIFYSWWQSKQKGEDPGVLSGTRTGNAIKTLTNGVPLIGELGSLVGDAMMMPEKQLRKLYGLDFNEFGQLGDQQIRKQISQMAADGEIDWRAALNAMNEKSGTIWDMAADRQRQEAMLKVPGFAGMEGIKQFVQGNTDIGSALGGMAISLLGGGMVYPQGEQQLRAEKASRDQAYIDQANGDLDAVSRWYDQYGPEYSTRTATYMNDPQELLKYTLYQNISNTYYAEPYERQRDIANQMGPEFRYALINKETKNWKAVPIEKLAEWNAMLGGKNPAVGSINVEGVSAIMRMSDQAVDVVQEYNTYKDEHFPGISIIQDMYYELPKDQRKAFLEAMPQLSDYWEWNRNYKNEHEEITKWLDDRSAAYNEDTYYNSYAEMSQRTQKELEYTKATGKELSDFASWELSRLYEKYANPNFMSYKDYVTGLQDWE